jgi:RHS repeat-associated protein
VASIPTFTNIQHPRPSLPSPSLEKPEHGRTGKHKKTYRTEKGEPFSQTDDSIDSQVLADGSATYAHGVTGLISENRGGTSKFYHTDALGSVRALTNTSGTVTDSRSTDAFGLVVTSSGSTPTPFGFVGNAGYQQDSETGLMRLGHRMYDASTGRFISRDPIRAGYNWYIYCSNDPVNTLDPQGLDVGQGDVRYADRNNPPNSGGGGSIGGGLVLGGLVALAALAKEAGDVTGGVVGAIGVGISVPPGGHSIGTIQPPLTGSPDGVYTHINAKGTAIQNGIYDGSGDLIGHVDWKNHGPGAPSGHGHVFPPRQPGVGHSPGAPHIPHEDLPSWWKYLGGIDPHTPVL